MRAVSVQLGSETALEHVPVRYDHSAGGLPRSNLSPPRGERSLASSSMRAGEGDSEYAEQAECAPDGDSKAILEEIVSQRAE